MIGNEAKSFGIEQTYISFTYPGYFPPPLTQLTFVPCDFTTENVVRGGEAPVQKTHLQKAPRKINLSVCVTKTRKRSLFYIRLLHIHYIQILSFDINCNSGLLTTKRL